MKSKCTSCISSDISTSTVAWGRVYSFQSCKKQIWKGLQGNNFKLHNGIFEVFLLIFFLPFQSNSFFNFNPLIFPLQQLQEGKSTVSKKLRKTNMKRITFKPLSKCQLENWYHWNHVKHLRTMLQIKPRKNWVTVSSEQIYQKTEDNEMMVYLYQNKRQSYTSTGGISWAI